MIRVGLTGGIGSGKSTVSTIFKTLGVPVFHADDESKALLGVEEVKKKIVELLGADILGDNGDIDRRKVAGIVFKDEGKLNSLNEILHPLVKDKFNVFCEAHKEMPYVIQEAAILFESGAWKHVDKIISVSCSEEIRIERVMKRDGARLEDVKARISRQMKEEERNKRADFVIRNDESELLIPQVLEINEKLVVSGLAAYF